MPDTPNNVHYLRPTTPTAEPSPMQRIVAAGKEWNRLAALAAEPVDPSAPPVFLTTTEEEAEISAKIEKARRRTVDGLTDPEGFVMLARMLPTSFLADATPLEIAVAVDDMAKIPDPEDAEGAEQFTLSDMPTEH
ncbi:hypothetical protein ACC685_33455 [Rhizobium ruizarguesonis]